jgi:hypothetical protein
MNSNKKVTDYIITDIFWDRKIKCRRCYKTFSQTEYYKQCVVNIISDAHNGEFDRDLEMEFRYFIDQINLQCRHFKCVIL